MSDRQETAIVRYWRIVKALPLLAFITLCVVIPEGLRMLYPFSEYKPQHVRVAEAAGARQGETTNQETDVTQDNEIRD